MSLKLILGNKNYSSWSLRPWLALAEHDIPFEEEVIHIYDPASKPKILRYSPAGKMPILLDGENTIWDSLAILETLADKFPQLDLWPKDPAARALARSISAEMHSGFVPLRKALPMNLKRTPAPPKAGIAEDVQADIRRICEIFRDARTRFGARGDFLFGAFSAADCMFAPVATRLRTYAVRLDAACEGYIEAIHHLASFERWKEAALKEPWAEAQYDAM
ncbi:MAG: glutathione S-transferase family protein [Xanthobacteraceae bacterium]|nr:glutathione S-transferase family protein [Xanthobacteraceae bacterium]